MYKMPEEKTMDDKIQEAVAKALEAANKKHEEDTQKAIEKALKESETKAKQAAGLEKARKAKAEKEQEAKKNGIYITYGGTYFHKRNTVTTAETYEVELQLIDNPNYRLPREDKLKQLGRAKLLPYYFKSEAKEEFPFFNGVREVKIIDVKVIGGDKKLIERQETEDKPINSMTMKQLVDFTIEKDLTSSPDTYSSLANARAAVEEEWENRKIAERDQYGINQIEEQKKEEEFADVKELLEFRNIN